MRLLQLLQAMAVNRVGISTAAAAGMRLCLAKNYERE
jgi:hypothetical protein